MVERVDGKRRKKQEKVIEKKSSATWCIIELVC
jgi:hypothetical protein